MSADSISVITLTRGRQSLLRRAIRSVYDQDYEGDVEHVVVIDDDPDSVAVVEAAPTRAGRSAVAHLVPRRRSEANEPPGDRRLVYPRIARLLNAAPRLCSSTWIAYLDDDNEFEPNHLSSLVARARETGASSVHSGRQIVWADGSPYLEERWHTVHDPDEGARIYELMCDRGVRVRGTNIVLDRADPVPVPSAFHPSSVVQANDPIFLVDQSVWLIRRELALKIRIPEVYTEKDYESNTAPDDKFLREVLAAGVAIASTRLPTVRYYLGGISNNRRREQHPNAVGRVGGRRGVNHGPPIAGSVGGGNAYPQVEGAIPTRG